MLHVLLDEKLKWNEWNCFHSYGREAFVRLNGWPHLPILMFTMNATVGGGEEDG